MLTITLPLPSAKLSPNARVYWRRKAEETKKARTWAYYGAITATQQSRPRWTLATVRCRFYFARPNRRDKDNLAASCKAIWDGFTDAGIWTDDSGVTHLPPEILIDPKNPRLEIEIEGSHS